MNGQRRRRSGGPRRAAAGWPGGKKRGAEYLVTFPAGLSSLVEACLRDDLTGVTTRYSDDSALLLLCRSPRELITRLPYLKNTFEVILEVPRMSIDAAAHAIAERVQRTAPERLGAMRSFRLMAQVDGQLSPLDRRAKEALERALKAQTGATVNARGGSGDEVWLIGRRELPQIVFARRLSKPESVDGPLLSGGAAARRT